MTIDGESTEWRLLRTSGQSLLVQPRTLAPATGGVRSARSFALPLRPTLGKIDQLSLTLILAQRPGVGHAALIPLVLRARLLLPLSLALGPARGTYAPVFLPSIEAILSFGGEVLNVARAAGSNAQIVMEALLPRDAALAALEAFNWSGPGPTIQLSGLIANPPPFEPVDLRTLLVEAKARPEVSLAVADGSNRPVEAVWRDVATGQGPAKREGDPVAMVRDRSGAIQTSLQLAPEVARRPSAAALIASHLVADRIRIGEAQAAFQVGDLVVRPTPEAGSDLPLVEDPAGALWRSETGVAWYPAVFTLVLPNPSDPPDTAAFSFVVSSQGPVLTPGASGLAAGISAEIRLTLVPSKSEQTVAAWAASGQKGTLQAVPLDGLSVTLELDFRVRGETGLRTQRLPATIEPGDSRLSCTVTVLDDWARLVYAGLSGLQQGGLPAVRLVVAYGFQARVPVHGRVLSLVSGGKIVGLPLVYNRSGLTALGNRTALVAAERSIVSDNAVLSFPLERAGQRSKAPAAFTAASTRPTFAIAATGATNPLHAIQPHDRIDATANGLHVNDDTPIVAQYGIQSIVRQQAIAVQISCGAFGGLYLQADADGQQHAIGCQDALRLGETSARAFDEIPRLRQPDYRVWRSLQQPGRFLVQPTAYRVARYSSQHPTLAFRPAMMLYGALTDERDKDRYTLSATLIADVSAARLALLRSALVAFSPAGVIPTIFWPTDPSTGAVTAASWSAPGTIPPETLVVINGVTVSFAANATDALLLSAMIGHGGLIGQLSFTLSDGLRLDGALMLDGVTAGPADVGPVTAAVSANGEEATLTNRTAQAMNVFGLTLIDALGTATAAPAGLTMAPGEVAAVKVQPGTVSALADARPHAAVTLDELDIFVEDVTQTVQFINQIEFDNHGIVALAVAARIAGNPHEEGSALAKGAVISLAFTLPITAYLRPSTLEYTFTVSDAAGVRTTAWRSRDLKTGAVIGVTYDQL